MKGKRISRMEETELYNQIFAALRTDETERLALYNALARTNETDAAQIRLHIDSGGACLQKEGGASFWFTLGTSGSAQLRRAETDCQEPITGCA